MGWLAVCACSMCLRSLCCMSGVYVLWRCSPALTPLPLHARGEIFRAVRVRALANNNVQHNRGTLPPAFVHTQCAESAAVYVSLCS